MTNVKHCENHRKAKSNNKTFTKQIGKNFLMIAFPIWKVGGGIGMGKTCKQRRKKKKEKKKRMIRQSVKNKG